METRLIVEAMILILAFSVVLIVWPGMRRFMLGFVRNSALGLCLLWLCGQALGVQFQVSLSLATGGVCGLLGLPGAALLLILKGFVV